MSGAPSPEMSRAFLVGIFVVGVGLAVAVALLGVYGYIGAGIP